MLKLLLIYKLVELNLLYKMHYFTFFLPLKKVPSFSFFSMTLILKKARFTYKVAVEKIFIASRCDITFCKEKFALQSCRLQQFFKKNL